MQFGSLNGVFRQTHQHSDSVQAMKNYSFKSVITVLTCTLIVSLFEGQDVLAQQTEKTGMPSIIQLGFGPFGSYLPGDGQDYCYPTAATMLFFWLQTNGYSQLTQAYSESAALNLDSVFGGLMQTSATGGTSNSDYINGLDTYLQAEGVSTSNFSWNSSDNPSLEWFASNNGPTTVTLAGLSWYQQNAPNSDFYIQNGGHGTALVYADTNASTITVNNPYPSTFLNVPNTSAQNPMTVDIEQVPTNWVLQYDHTTPYIQVTTPILGPNPPNTGSPGNLGVYDTALALTLSTNAQPTNPSYSIATWSINSIKTLNTGGGNLPVIAPLSDGVSSSGGLDKEGSGTLILENSNTLTGFNEINGGTVSSTENSSQCPSPFGFGSMIISGHGFLEFAPNDNSPGAMSFTLSSGTQQYLQVDGGAGMLIFDRGSNPSLNVTIGGFSSGSHQNIRLTNYGTLVFSVPTSLSELGSQVQVFVNGGTNNAPPVTNGMVTPAIVALQSSTSDPAAFLTYGASNGFSLAGTISGDINSADSTTIYSATNNQTITSAANLQAIIVNNVSVGGGSLAVGPQTSGNAGVIFNGGTISSPLQYGSANAYVYSSAAGGILSGAISGSGSFTTFGPGTLTLESDSSATHSGNIFVNSGTLLIASNAVTGSGSLTLQNDATLQVGGIVTGAVSVSNSATVTLQGGTLAGGITVLSNGTLQGSGTISGTATILGVVQPSGRSAPGNLTFNGSSSFVDSQFFWTLNSLTTNPTEAGISWNTLTFNGPTTFAEDNVTFYLDIPPSQDPNGTNSFWDSNESWVFATGTNGAFSSGNSVSVENWSWDSGWFDVKRTNSDSELVLNFYATPEPSICALLALSGVAIAIAARRKVS